MAKCIPGCQCRRHLPARQRDKLATCTGCKQNFLAFRRNALYCSYECRYAVRGDQIREIARQTAQRWRDTQPAEVIEARRAARRTKWHERRRDFISEFWRMQDGKCYLCADPLQEITGTGHDVHLDHDHSCCQRGTPGCWRCRRGLACQRCNLLVGYGNDDPDRLRFIAANLEAAKAAVLARMQ